MISLRFYLDTRRPSRRPDGRFPLKLAVTKRGDTALLPVAAFATREEWNQDLQRMRGRMGRDLEVNRYLVQLLVKCDDLVQRMVLSGEAAPLTASGVRDRLAAVLLDTGAGVSFGEYYDRIAATKHGSTARTFRIARAAFVRADSRIMSRPLASITEKDVARIDTFLRAHFAPTSRNTYISKLAHVLKSAHKEGLSPADAGREIRIRQTTTKSRALTVEQLRLFLGAEPERERAREALDFFRLSFYLRAMNPVDIWKATPDYVFNGRLQYTRSKTGKDYSVKVEPEAQRILDARSSASRLFETSARDYGNFLQDTSEELRRIAKDLELPPVTMYWARHTFASLLVEIGETIETVAAALGHSYGPRITMGYVTIREKAVDDAVRRLFDYVAGTWEPE